MLHKLNTVNLYWQKALRYRTVLDSVVLQSLYELNPSLEEQACGKSDFVSLWEHLGTVELIETVFVCLGGKKSSLGTAAMCVGCSSVPSFLSYKLRNRYHNIVVHRNIPLNNLVAK